MAWQSTALAVIWFGMELLAMVESLAYSVSSCQDLAIVPTPMTDDTHIVLTGDIRCRSLKTVYISGPYAYLLTSDKLRITFSNVRFVVKNEADFFVTFHSDEAEGMATFIGEYEQQQYDGGTFKIGPGCSATFGVPVIFKNLSVRPDKSGGAIYNEGYLTFEYSASFDSNKVSRVNRGTLRGAEKKGAAPPRRGRGGALYNGDSAVTTFKDASSFRDNSAGLGSAGGAVYNDGLLAFLGDSIFTGNAAEADTIGHGGEGGAVYTGPDAHTIFNKLALFRSNRAGRAGGALHTTGATTMRSGGTFSRNRAQAPEEGRGGHVYASGVLNVNGDVKFDSGTATGDGGALYISPTGDAYFTGGLEFIHNEARNGQCHNVFDSGSTSNVCPSVE